jgi:hypothetical protein
MGTHHFHFETIRSARFQYLRAGQTVDGEKLTKDALLVGDESGETIVVRGNRKALRRVGAGIIGAFLDDPVDEPAVTFDPEAFKAWIADGADYNTAERLGRTWDSFAEHDVSGDLAVDLLFELRDVPAVWKLAPGVEAPEAHELTTLEGEDPGAVITVTVDDVPLTVGRLQAQQLIGLEDLQDEGGRLLAPCADVAADLLTNVAAAVNALVARFRARTTDVPRLPQAEDSDAEDSVLAGVSG